MGDATPRHAQTLMRHLAWELRAAGIEDPEKEAELILAWAAGMERLTIYRDNPGIDKKAVRRAEEAMRRRAAREPLEYILGEVDFMGLRISVGPGVLIPRPETELLIEALVKHACREKTRRILDLGTGSGPLALAAARALRDSHVTATDISEKALSYARGNAKANNVRNVSFLMGRLFEPVGAERFDVIISNPPYIRSAELDTLQPEIRDWEPRLALNGGPDGMRCYEDILREAPAHLETGGLIILELGWGQREMVAGIACSRGLDILETRKDFSGIERVMTLRLPAQPGRGKGG